MALTTTAPRVAPIIGMTSRMRHHQGQGDGVLAEADDEEEHQRGQAGAQSATMKAPET